ncbi:MAG TPA: hypothetical protein VKF32_14955 [Thermoanaerobaculia bacterium]|nr:hypothetical protein [Thermoanaerobaculia bacterium]
MAKTIVALFDTRSEAEGAVRRLEDLGFTHNDVSLVANGAPAAADAAAPLAETAAPESGAGAGALVGAGIGGAAGLLASLAGLTIPVIGPILAAGPLVAALTGLGVGAATGGLVGALANTGVPEEEAELYSEGIRRGGTLVMVTVADLQAERVADLMGEAGAVDIEKRASEWTTGGWRPQYGRTRASTTGLPVDAGAAPGSVQSTSAPIASTGGATTVGVVGSGIGSTGLANAGGIDIGGPGSTVAEVRTRFRRAGIYDIGHPTRELEEVGVGRSGREKK